MAAFCEKNKKEITDFSMNTIMDFLLDMFYDADNSFNMVKHAVTFVRTVKKLSGETISQSDWMIIDKFLSGAFNQKPPIHR